MFQLRISAKGTEKLPYSENFRISSWSSDIESRISPGAIEKLPCSENLSISSWSYDIEGHAKKCVE